MAPERRREQVVIIGAGASGLAAARLLGRHGIRPVLLEAAPLIGGRIRTLRAPGWQLPIELGAEFVHGRPSPTLALGGGAIELTAVPEHRLIAGENETTGLWSRLAELLEPALTREGPSSVAEYLASARLSRADERLVSMMVEGYHAASLDDVSAQTIAADAVRARQEFRQYRTARGYDSVLDTLESDLGELGVRVELGMRVRRIDWEPRRVQLQVDNESGGGCIIDATRCLITVSIGVLKRAPSEGGIDFRPVPESFARALPQLGMGHALRVVLRFEKAPWPLGADGAPPTFLHDPESPFSTFWREARAGQEQVTAWAGGPAAQQLSQLDPAPLIHAALTSLSRASGRSFVECRDALLAAHHHDFERDPLIRGAYSYVKPGGEDAARILSEPCWDTLFFAGEALDLQYPATVAGALGSGEHAARRLLSTWR